MREILNIDRQRPADSMIAEASSILRAGGIVAYPTETFYGLGADGQNEEAIKRIFLIKGRNFKNPISVIIGDANHVSDPPSRPPGHLPRRAPAAGLPPAHRA